MKLTSFKFFKDTPFTDFNNTILFKSEAERDNFFLNGNHYPSFETSKNFNFIRDRQVLDLSISYEQFRGFNYCTFLSDFEPDTRYYAFIVDYEYLNDNAIRVYLLIDGIMTYLQGDKINKLENLSIERSHLDKAKYNELEDFFKNNDDIIQTYTKKYTHSYEYLFKDLDVLIHSSANLTTDFGKVDDPKVETSDGLTFDKISSPLNIYVVEQKDFKEFMKQISKFAWIAQNIRAISLIPNILLKDQKVKVKTESLKFDKLYSLMDNGRTYEGGFSNELKDSLNKNMNELYKIFNLDPEQDKHLLRNGYTTTEIYTFNGQQLYIDNGQLDKYKGLVFKPLFISGFHTEIGIYIEGYKGRNTPDKDNGSFINDAIFFDNFDEIPILIDNYSLSLSKSANRRQVAESRLVTNRINSVLDSSEDTKDRFYNAVSLASNLNPITLFGKFNDEHEYYKNQQAEFKDMALETPSLTNQSNNNSLAISQDFYGIHVKHAQPSISEWKEIKKYYKAFGFLLNEENSTLKVDTMSIANYVKFTGNYIIKNADVSILETTRARFEAGVRLWHNNNTPNPMKQDLIENIMIK